MEDWDVGFIDRGNWSKFGDPGMSRLIIVIVSSIEYVNRVVLIFLSRFAEDRLAFIIKELDLF